MSEAGGPGLGLGLGGPSSPESGAVASLLDATAQRCLQEQDCLGYRFSLLGSSLTSLAGLLRRRQVAPLAHLSCLSAGNLARCHLPSPLCPGAVGEGTRMWPAWPRHWVTSLTVLCHQFFEGGLARGGLLADTLLHQKLDTSQPSSPFPLGQTWWVTLGRFWKRGDHTS